MIDQWAGMCTGRWPCDVLVTRENQRRSVVEDGPEHLRVYSYLGCDDLFRNQTTITCGHNSVVGRMGKLGCFLAPRRANCVLRSDNAFAHLLRVHEPHSTFEWCAFVCLDQLHHVITSGYWLDTSLQLDTQVLDSIFCTPVGQMGGPLMRNRSILVVGFSSVLLTPAPRPPVVAQWLWPR